VTKKGKRDRTSSRSSSTGTKFAGANEKKRHAAPLRKNLTSAGETSTAEGEEELCGVEKAVERHQRVKKKLGGKGGGV